MEEKLESLQIANKWKMQFRELTLDPNTANINLSLSEDNRKVAHMRESQLYPHHPDRFEIWQQVLCTEGLTGSGYWEVEWSGGVSIAVTYRGINRRGQCDDSLFGYYNMSWCLDCFEVHQGNWYFVRHNRKTTILPVRPSGSNRVGVYLDCPAGTLSFYRVSSDSQTHLYTFQSTFTEPLYPGFWCWCDSSVYLCRIEEVQ